MANRTVIFTTTDLIKRARKYGREHQDAWGIDKMSPEEFQKFSEEINHLATTFFNLAKITEHPEQEFLGFALRGGMNEKDNKPTKVACLLLHYAAQSLIEDKIQELNKCLEKNRRYTSEAVDWWRRYEEVRSGGDYNMIMDAAEAAEEAGLTMDQYKYVINNYSSLQAESIIDDALSQEAPF